jgi:hypothetical protein
MTNWLQKILPPTTPARKTILPAQRMPASPSDQSPPASAGLPAASVVYAIAAAALFAIAICFLVSGAWLTGLLVLLPAACFLGFSLHFLKND